MNQSIKLERQQAEKPKLNITLTGICLAVMLLCGLAVGTLPQTLIAFVVIVCSGILFFSKGIWLAFPIMIFYYESFGILFGMSVYRYFTFIFLFYILLTSKNFTLKFSHIVPIVIFAIYSIVIVAPDDIRRAIFVVLDVVCIWLLISCFLNELEHLKSFFRVYVFTALCAFITGTIINSTRVINQVIGGELVEIARNYGTFEDPNYMGLFYSVAVFAIMSLSLFPKVWRIVLVISLTAMMLTTLSITALLVNIVFWLIYLFANKKINIVTFCCFILVLVALLGLYSYGVNNPDTPVIGNFVLRIQDKLDSLSSGDINEVTTNRTELTQRHWDYFWEQPVLKMLFGMNPASVLKTDIGGYKSAAHNEYVDLLLNIGILGTLLYLGVMFTRTAKSFIRVRRDGDAYSNCIFMMKVIWLAYGLTLTMFGDYRFMLLFLI